MPLQTGTSTDYIDLLDQLVDVVRSDHVITAVINAAGTGYVVGDSLAVAGGTFTHQATLLVTAVGGGGAITGIRIFNNGAYTADPSLTGNAVTGGTGTGATMDLTMQLATWNLLRETREALSAVVAAGGTGYAVSDQLTVAGGVGVETAAIFNVDAVAAGVVTAVSLVTAGKYEDVPANPAATTGGGGTGATLTVTYQRFTGTTDRTAIIEGTGLAGSDSIPVGIKTYQATDQSGFDTVFNWGLLGMTAFNAGLQTHLQPGASPGFVAGGTPATTGGAYVPLKPADAFDMTFWIFHNGQRIILVAKVETASTVFYPSMYVGLMNRFGTALEFPFPVAIVGSTALENSRWDDAQLGRVGGISEMVGINSPAHSGPGFYLRSDSVWAGIRNSTTNNIGSSHSASKDVTAYPSGQTTVIAATEDNIVSDGGFSFDDMVPPTGLPGNPLVKLQLTPLTSGDLRLLVPVTICASNGTFLDILGELDGVFWFYAANLEASEDTITDANGAVHRVFGNGSRFEEFTFFAVKEE